METMLRDLEEELTGAAQAAVQRLVGRARTEVARVLEAARTETEAGLAEVARKRGELAMEVAALHKVSLAQESRVVLDVGGTEYVTSVATLRSRAGSMLDAMLSGRYAVDVCEDGGYRVFLDRDGELFGHVLAYLREGVVGVGVEEDVGVLGRLKREFGYFCLDLYKEREVCVSAGGYVGNAKYQGVASVERYEAGRWVEVSSMGQGRMRFGACAVDGSMYVAGGYGPDEEDLASVQRYEASSDTWTSVADKPEPRHCAWRR